MIGRGSYSTVRLAKCRDTGEIVAVKVFKKSEMEPDEMDSIYSEIEFLKELKGQPGIVEFKDVWDGQEHLCVILEYVGVDLYRYMNKHHKELTEDEIRRIFKMTA